MNEWACTDCYEYKLAWEAAEKRCGELQGQLKSQRELSELVEGELLELLRKSKKYFDWFIYEYETDHIEGFEMLLDELTEELG